LKSYDTNSIPADKTFPSLTTSLPPLTISKHDSGGSGGSRPTSTESILKSGRREKKNRDKSAENIESPPTLAPVASTDDVGIETECSSRLNAVSTGEDTTLNTEAMEISKD
jgi:hypothetical protein